MNIETIGFGDYTAGINLSRGANCISLKNEKLNAGILREPDYSAELDNPYLYGMPVLFPVNRISGGEFEFEGRKYIFPINEPKTNCHLHGLLHTAEFEITEKGENFIKCRYISDDLYEFFPHKFSVEISYTLTDDGLMQETCVSNLSDENMPVLLGFHTTFKLPFIEGSSPDGICVLADVGDEIERDMSVYLPTGKISEEDEITRQFKKGKFKPYENKISRHYKAAGEGRIEIADTSKGIKIVYENDKKFGWRLFYNMGSDEFICLEPQNCMANCCNSEFSRDYAGFDYIEPGQNKKYVSRLYLEEIAIDNE